MYLPDKSGSRARMLRQREIRHRQRYYEGDGRNDGDSDEEDDEEDEEEEEEEELKKCLPRLRILGEHLQELTIHSVSDLCLDHMLSKAASACPHLTNVCIHVFPRLSEVLTDMGLVSLTQLLNLKRVEVCGSKDVTNIGVTALALSASVEAIHVRACTRFKRPNAQRVMNMVKLPYLDITAT